MKKYIYSLLSAVALLGFTSCDDTQEEPHIQWYPVVTVEGPSKYQLELGESFAVPGFTAVNTMTGEDASSAVTVTIYDVIAREYVDAITTDSPGWFNIYYTSAASEVQLSSNYNIYKQVDVYVYDPTVTSDISGTWMVNVDDSFRVRYSGANAGQELSFAAVAEGNNNDISAGIPVKISQIVPGFYYVDDLEAGLVSMLYGYAAGYPSLNFQMHGYVSLDSENKLTVLTTTFGYSGWATNYALTDFEGEYVPGENVIKYRATLGNQGYYLDVVLEQP